MKDAIKPYSPIINQFITKYNYKTYLELGICNKDNTFNHVVCADKTGVDIQPSTDPTYAMSTDEFFQTVAVGKTWDIIFIDASHEKTQALRDFENSLKHLSENGTIIMDDINPNEAFLLEPRYCHNVWEVFATLRGTRSDLDMFGIEGSVCGVVRRGSQITHNLTIEPTFEFLDKHRQELINVLTWEEVCKK
jgi:hypothetical protein